MYFLAIWVPGGIVGVAWPQTPRRLGIVFSTSRPSYIFFLVNNGTFMKLSREELAAHSPRLSSDKDYVVWLQRPVYGPQHACHELVKLVWGGFPHTLVPIVLAHTECASGHHFTGLYCESLPNRCFIDNNTLLLSTCQHTRIKSYFVNTETGDVHQVRNRGGSLIVLDVCGTMALFNLMEIDTPSSLYLGNVNELHNFSVLPLVVRNAVPPVANVQQYIFNMRSKMMSSFKYYNAIYYGPVKGTRSSVPLIVWPHGEPHSAFYEFYSVINQFFVSAGFATLQVNFRGSTGMGQAGVDFLLGKVSKCDVFDCHQAAREALGEFEVLDSKRVVLYGGSHGGFLVTHLAGKYPGFYKAVVACNPVVDFISSLATSNSPDWVVAEAGFTYTGKEFVKVNPRLFQILSRMSPIKKVVKVIAPTLLNIGKKDLLVHPSQGIQYYHALKAYKRPCKMYLYDDNHSLSTVPVEMDVAINAVLWFLEHIPNK